MYTKLENIQKGYADIVCSDMRLDVEDPEGEILFGYISQRDVVSYTDFETDEIHYVKRWFVAMYFKPDFIEIGRITGYRTRKEAIEYFKERVKEETGWQ